MKIRKAARTHRVAFRVTGPSNAKMMGMELVRCELCGDWFTARRSTARFCSGACRVWRHRHPEGGKLTDAERERIGRGRRPCGNPDCDKWLFALDRPDKKYCSAACKQKEWRANRPIDLTGFREAFGDLLN